jgi:hypothetical protein
MPGIRILGTGADTLNSLQASYFERFHWPILNFWTLQTVEHDGNGRESQLQIDNFKWHLPLIYIHCLEIFWRRFMRFNTLHHIHKMLQICWRKSFWTRCKLVILNVFIGQFWIFGHYRPWSMTAMEHGTACSAVCSVNKFKIDQWKRSIYTHCLETIWNFLEKIHAF